MSMLEALFAVALTGAACVVFGWVWGLASAWPYARVPLLVSGSGFGLGTAIVTLALTMSAYNMEFDSQAAEATVAGLVGLALVLIALGSLWGLRAAWNEEKKPFALASAGLGVALCCLLVAAMAVPGTR